MCQHSGQVGAQRRAIFTIENTGLPSLRHPHQPLGFLSSSHTDSYSPSREGSAGFQPGRLARGRYTGLGAPASSHVPSNGWELGG